MLSAIKDNLLHPLRHMRLSYVPLLLIYFAYGFSTFNGIAETFWIKEHLGLDTQAILAIGIWASIPWTIKMIVGQFVDCINFFSNRYKSYIAVGGVFLSFGYLILAGISHPDVYILVKDSIFGWFLFSNVLLALGFVIQDVVADTMTTKIVARKNMSEAEYNKEISMVQVLGRLSLSVGVILASLVSGILAAYVPIWIVYTLGLTIPFVGVLGAYLIKIDVPTTGQVNNSILYGGIAYGIFCAAMGFLALPFNQEIVFIVSLAVVGFLLWQVCKDLPLKTKKIILSCCFIIFAFRATPGVGPGGTWWQIDVLGFDEIFLSHLSQISAVVGLVGIWIFSKWISKQEILKTFTLLTLIGGVLALPMIGLAFGLHIWTAEIFGFGAKTIALLDVAAASPFAVLSMIPALALVAKYAPKHGAATWFALMTSLMNLALNAGTLLTKYLNIYLPVERGLYANIPDLMILSTILSIVIPLVIIYLFRKPLRAQN